MIFTIYQINSSRELTEEINRLGREKAAEHYPQYRALLNIVDNGVKGYQPEHFQHYNLVCTCSVDSTEFVQYQLEEIFQKLNLWDESDAPVTIIVKMPMHSLSVGDIVRSQETGIYYMVGVFGFEPVEVPMAPVK